MSRTNGAMPGWTAAILGATMALAATVSPSLACPSDALGTSRVVPVGGEAPVRIGLKSYPQTLDLRDKEVVLTFDDGPSAATTPDILDALSRQCVKATFFLVGRNSTEHPAIVARERLEGHTIGHHSFSHPAKTLASLLFEAAVADIEQGIEADERAAEGPTSDFFRFPGFGDSPDLLAELARRRMPVFGADLWASDWNKMSPDEELRLLMSRLRKAKGGIVLLHDSKRQTADMLPRFLATLKNEGFHVVHVVPDQAIPPLRAAAPGWTSATEAVNRKVLGKGM
jgi:peptidoglycan/xylan/chitin deacetylase (PgdA/CDA1 family)